MTVTNTGNTSLAGVTITDAMLSLTAAPVSPADLAPTESATLAGLVYTITALDQGAGQVVNTATAAGQPVATLPDGSPDTSTPLVDLSGDPLAPVEDISDTQTDPDLDGDGNPVLTGDPDSDGADNPTVLNLPAIEPELTLIKSITEVTDVNGNGLLGDIGDEITYTLTVTDTGNTSLAGVTITDTKLGLAAVAVSPADLAPTDSATLSGQVYTITCLLYTSPSPRDRTRSRMPSSA